MSRELRNFPLAFRRKRWAIEKERGHRESLWVICDFLKRKLNTWNRSLRPGNPRKKHECLQIKNSLNLKKVIFEYAVLT